MKLKKYSINSLIKLIYACFIINYIFNESNNININMTSF